MFSKFTKFGQTFGPQIKFNKIFSRGMRNQFKKPDTQTASTTFGWVLLGIGVGGLGYLTWSGSQARADHTRSLISSGSTVSKDITLMRTKQTLQYFAGSIGLTAGMTALMLRSPTILKYSFGWSQLFLTLPASFFCIYKMYTTPQTPENDLQRSAYWIGFNALMAFSLVPSIHFAELMVVRDAFLLTSGCFAGLGWVTYNSRDDAFLGMSGILGAGLGGMVALSIANIFLQSPALFNIWLYGGLALFLGFTLYDMKEVQVRAARSAYFDPMRESIKVYLDFINIFIRLLYILQGNKNRK